MFSFFAVQPDLHLPSHELRDQVFDRRLLSSDGRHRDDVTGRTLQVQSRASETQEDHCVGKGYGICL